MRPSHQLREQAEGSRERPARKATGQMVTARKRMWPLVSQLAKADFLRIAESYDEQELTAVQMAASQRLHGWDVTSRRAVPLLNELVAEGYLEVPRRRHYRIAERAAALPAVTGPHVELARLLNDLTPTLLQRYDHVEGAKLWILGFPLVREEQRRFFAHLSAELTATLAAKATPPSEIADENRHRFASVRLSMLTVPEHGAGQPKTVVNEALQLLVSTVGADFAREFGDVSRAEEVIQRELIQALTQEIEDAGLPLLDTLKDRYGISTWRTLDRWRKYRSIHEMETVERGSGYARVHSWLVDELAKAWPGSLSRERLVQGLLHSSEGEVIPDPQLLDRALGTLVARDRVRRINGERPGFQLNHPSTITPLGESNAAEAQLTAYLTTVAESLATFDPEDPRFGVKTGMVWIERSELEALSGRLRTRLSEIMDEALGSSPPLEQSSQGADTSTRLLVVLRPGPLPI